MSAPRKVLWRWKRSAPCPFMTGYQHDQTEGLVLIHDSEYLGHRVSPGWVKRDEIETKDHP